MIGSQTIDSLAGAAFAFLGLPGLPPLAGDNVHDVCSYICQLLRCEQTP